MSQWIDYLAYFVGGVVLTNAIPHFVSGLMGRAFQTPFAKPPGKGLSSSTVNVLWGGFNLALGYLLILRVGTFDPRRTEPYPCGRVWGAADLGDDGPWLRAVSRRQFSAEVRATERQGQVSRGESRSSPFALSQPAEWLPLSQGQRPGQYRPGPAAQDIAPATPNPDNS